MKSRQNFFLFLIVSLGLFLRLYGLNWDQGFHLHPDERFLTMVSTDISFPNSIGEYFDRHTSSLNPENNKHTFFVYGLAPITINKFIGELLLNNTYDTIHLQGRVLSAFADMGIVLILFFLLKLFEIKFKLAPSLKYIAAILYSVAVLPIQLSHFFTVDTFMNFFGWASIYFSTRAAMQYTHQNATQYTLLSSLFFGLAIASKISALLYAPLIGLGLLYFIYKYKPLHKNKVYLGGFGFLLVILFYVSVRIGSPYYFDSGNIFNLSLSEQFLHNIRTLKSFEDPNGYFPPAIQWIHAPWYLVLTNIVNFGLGIPYAILVLVGCIKLYFRSPIWKVVIMWTISILIYQSFQFAKTMRYLIFIYPLLAIYGAFGFYYVKETLFKRRVKYRNLILSTIGIAVLVWPMSFMSIYTKNHSRVEASYWIFDNVPNGSTIAWEYWDDPLPLLVQNPMRKQFNSEQIGIFDPDSAEKWNRIQNQLLRSDYYVMSSNRGWGSIPTVPERYPLTTDFYKDMFANKRGFTLIKEFTSYPSLRYLGIPLDFPDQWAEEAFTVYDHPKVMIFKRNMR